MILESLRLYQFRNHDELSWNFTSGRNVLSGPNGCGKTNVLEAIAVLSSGRSPRAPEFKEVLQWGKTACSIKGAVRTQAGRLNLEVRFDKQKEIFLNGEPVERLENLWGQLPMMFFTPLSCRLAWDDASHRRRFLNGLLISSDKDYKTSILRYHQVLAERNAGLKRIRSGALRPGTQEVWDQALAELAVSLMKKRRDIINSLNSTAPRYYNEMADGGSMNVMYQPSVPWEIVEAGPAAFLKELEQKRSLEVALGTTVIGPHRDDLELTLDSKSVRHFASQGQQRSVVLALHLAGRDALQERLGHWPLCLYDDVFSELDSQRRGRLWALMGQHGQSFFTTVGLTEAEARGCHEFKMGPRARVAPVL